MNILIAGAWPYANGPLHIGHIAALLPGDVLARYHRLKGDNVCYVSGCDCHGTPISIAAEREGVPPGVVADRWHADFVSCFERLGFTYDLYTKTSDAHHVAFVQGLHRAMYASGLVDERQTEQAWCERCGRFLPDRFVRGRCPRCGEAARGDQCEACGEVLEPERLLEPVCALCGQAIAFRPSRHLFLCLSALQGFLSGYLARATHWRKNALGLTARYVQEGLPDRTLTRDLDWGIDVPKEGYEGKKIYIWAENVLGYLSASKHWCDDNGQDWDAFWRSDDARHYYVHGKDNVPFHTVILPALLQAAGGYHLPDRVASSEYLTLEGRKISTSANWAVWAGDLLDRYDADSIRYFLIANGPEKRNSDFTFREFIHSHNAELLGAFGNLVNRTLAFAARYLGNRIPGGAPDAAVAQRVCSAFQTCGRLIEELEFKAALDEAFELVRELNRFYDERRPWVTRTADPAQCSADIGTCAWAIANLSRLLEPFLPFSCARIRAMLGLGEPAWGPEDLPAGELGPVDVLFRRIEEGRIAQEEQALTAGR